MSISSISVVQDNFVNGSDLLPVHSPLAFIVDVTFSGDVPDVINVEIYDDATLLDTYRAIVYRDASETVRQFVFKASQAIRTLLEDFSDFNQASETLLHVPEMSRTLTLRFVDPDNAATYDELTATFLHAAAQYGEAPNKDAIFNNDIDRYYAIQDGIVYVYFYNDDPSNVLTIGGTLADEGNAVDFNDDPFVDFNDDNFTITGF